MNRGKLLDKLFERYLNNQCSPVEVKALLKYFDAEEDHDQLKSLIRQHMEHAMAKDESTDARLQILAESGFIKIKDAISDQYIKDPIRTIPIYQRKWYLVAASVSLLLLASTALYVFQRRMDTVFIAQKNNPAQHFDIDPGRNNATLTLDNGTTIVLDSAANGTLAQQGNADVQKINGQISYLETKETENSNPVYNTVATANGNQYQLVLTDGSKVWLNAASSIRFPATFTSNERKVDITGEVYFEVAKDATKPFKVSFKDKSGASEEIQVLGTHFNVNAYPDEPEMKTTLLEGSVRIKNTNGVKMLEPGQQARIKPGGIEIKKDVDIEQVMAWKNGYFVFDNTDVYTLMRQVSRWYNVEINFKGNVTEDGFSGKISRDVPLSKIIRILEMNDVHIIADGRKITIGNKK
ncbi:MAG: FecR domain-containing protein [Ginsengibacter sp.]